MKRTPEHNRKIGAALRLAIVRSRPCECGCGEMTKPRPGRRQSRFVKGHESRGRKLSPEHREKIGVASRRKRGPHSPERKKKIAAALKGRSLPEAHRLAIAAATPRGEDHPLWKGSEAGYAAVHAWVRSHQQKTGRCERCGETRYTEFANVSGQYRRDLDDFVEVCKPCHIRLDRSRATRLRRPAKKPGL